MAFEFVVLTKEEKEEINSWGLKIPYCYCGKTYKDRDIKDPDTCSVDKKRNIYLIGVYHAIPDMEENAFAFLWKGKTYFVQFRLEYIDNNNCSWNIPNRYMSNDNVFPYCTEPGFIDDLRDALIAYGSGMQHIFGKIDTKCNF